VFTFVFCFLYFQGVNTKVAYLIVTIEVLRLVKISLRVKQLHD